MTEDKLTSLVNKFLEAGGKIKFINPTRVPRIAKPAKLKRKKQQAPQTIVRKRLPLKAKLRRKYTPLIPNKLYDNFSFWL